MSKFKETYKRREKLKIATKKVKIKITGNPRASWVRPIHQFIE
jgi:hypothetical protein